MQYRKEIDGLRALAVVPVMLFHAGVPGFAGGYVGVDVFFVISGYLITSILLEDHARERFSLLDFYERRIRRILPALYFVMLCCIPAAWLLLLPDDLENFGQSLVATTLFSNNILLWITSDYFQLEAEFKPLLHTWSLAVEEQYYIVFPALLGLLWRAGRQRLMLVLGTLAVVSLVAAQWASSAMPQANFYLIPFRAWELVAGAMVAVYFVGRREPVLVNDGLAWLGLAMVAASVVLYDSSTPFPGLYALVPVLGTVLFILFAAPATGAARAFSWQPLVMVGLMSYSLYLWHQPLLAFMRITRLEEPGAWETSAFLFASVVMAWLSWRFVEAPFRDRKRMSRGPLFLMAGASSVLILAIGLYFHATSGLMSRWPELLDAQGENRVGTGLNAAYNRRPYQFQADSFATNGKRNVLVMGDSFARDFINAGLENDYFRGVNLVYHYGHGLCSLERGLSAAQRRLVGEADDIVIAATLFADHAACVPGVAQLFAERDKSALIVGAKNFGWNNNAIMLLPESQRWAFRALPLERVRQANAAVSAATAGLSNLTFVDPMALLADDSGRVPVFTPERHFISQDRTHFTRSGAAWVGRQMLRHPAIQRLAAQASRPDS